MIPLYSQEEFKLAKPSNKLSCKCYYCNNPFLTTKHNIQQYLKGDPEFKLQFCSKTCANRFKNKSVLMNCNHCGTPINVAITQVNKSGINFCSKDCKYLAKSKKRTVTCINCNVEFEKNPFEIKRSPKHLCSYSCSASYKNKHKTHGTRRSKLEVYLETQLTILYPNLMIDYNKKDTIGSELDIYIPSLNLAFELNGLFHYEPIFGSGKLDQIKNNDISKSKACLDKQIDLCVIDTSGQKYFKESTSKKYLDIITNIINQRTDITKLT